MKMGQRENRIETHTHIHTNTHRDIYIYIQSIREREREGGGNKGRVMKKGEWVGGPSDNNQQDRPMPKLGFLKR
jgi:hypothetical protein